MQRNSLLVHNILSTIEQYPDAYMPANAVLNSVTGEVVGTDREPWPFDQVIGHLLLLENARLVEIETVESPDTIPPSPLLPRYSRQPHRLMAGICLTWQGHDYLANITVA